jgi:hypothetical protein
MTDWKTSINRIGVGTRDQAAEARPKSRLSFGLGHPGVFQLLHRGSGGDSAGTSSPQSSAYFTTKRSKRKCAPLNPTTYLLPPIAGFVVLRVRESGFCFCLPCLTSLHQLLYFVVGSPDWVSPEFRCCKTRRTHLSRTANLGFPGSSRIRSFLINYTCLTGTFLAGF